MASKSLFETAAYSQFRDYKERYRPALLRQRDRAMRSHRGPMLRGMASADLASANRGSDHGLAALHGVGSVAGRGRQLSSAGVLADATALAGQQDEQIQALGAARGRQSLGVAGLGTVANSASALRQARIGADVTHSNSARLGPQLALGLGGLTAQQIGYNRKTHGSWKGDQGTAPGAWFTDFWRR